MDHRLARAGGAKKWSWCKEWVGCLVDSIHGHQHAISRKQHLKHSVSKKIEETKFGVAAVWGGSRLSSSDATGRNAFQVFYNRAKTTIRRCINRVMTTPFFSKSNARLCP